MYTIERYSISGAIFAPDKVEYRIVAKTHNTLWAYFRFFIAYRPTLDKVRLVCHRISGEKTILLEK